MNAAVLLWWEYLSKVPGRGCAGNLVVSVPAALHFGGQPAAPSNGVRSMDRPSGSKRRRVTREYDTDSDETPPLRISPLKPTKKRKKVKKANSESNAS